MNQFQPPTACLCSSAGVDTLPPISPVGMAKWVRIFHPLLHVSAAAQGLTHCHSFRQSHRRNEWQFFRPPCFSLGRLDGDTSHTFRQYQWQNGWRRFLTSFRQYKRRNVAGQFWIVVFLPVREANCIFFKKKKVPQSRNFFKKCHKVEIFHNFYHKLVNCPAAFLIK